MIKPWKVLSTAALVLALSVSAVLPAFAANGDMTDTKTGIVYKAVDYRCNTAVFNDLTNQLIDGTRNQFTYEYSGIQYKFDDANDKINELVASGDDIGRAMSIVFNIPISKL